LSDDDVTADAIADAFWEEWMTVEAERMGIINDLFGVCRAMHDIQVRLNENMLQCLVENAWKESEVTRALAAATVSIIKAVNGLDYKRSAEGVFLEKCDPNREILWDFQNTGV
jgi:hypothetical protein